MLSKQVLFLATSALVASSVSFLPSAALAGDFGVGTSPAVNTNSDTTNQQRNNFDADNTQVQPENTDVNTQDPNNVVTRGHRSRTRFNPGNTVRRPAGSNPVDRAQRDSSLRFRLF